MSTSDLRKLSLRSRAPILIEVLDRRRRRVASGVGNLEVMLAPGLYVVAVLSGGWRKEQMVALEAGHDLTLADLDSVVFSVAPVLRTHASHEYQAGAAMDCSRTALNKQGNGARIVLFVRHVLPDAQEGDARLAAPLPLQQLALHDASGKLLFAFGHGAATIDPRRGIAAASVQVDPGAYVLRWREQTGAAPRERERWVAQALWVPRNWSLLCFLGHVPSVGLRRSAISFHLAEEAVGYEAWLGEEENLAMEIALTGLRTGQQLLDTRRLMALLNGKFSNPMLGIVGAHLLLQHPEPNPVLLNTVLSNLKQLVGGDHPDLIALRAMHGKEPLPPVSHPPMLVAGYRALLERDASDPGQLVDGSAADRVSAVLRPEAPWTTWTANSGSGGVDNVSLPPSAEAQPLAFAPAGFDSFHVQGARSLPLAPTPASVALPKAGLEHSMRETPEVRQVRRVLARGMSRDFDDADEERWTMERLARATALSVGAVRRAVGVLAARGEELPNLLE